MVDEPSDFLEAVERFYPDFCQRWHRLAGLGPDEVRALATLEGEDTRIQECLAGACVDFTRRYANLPAEDIPSMQVRAATVLKTAVLNGFVLGVWLGQQGLARYPAPPPPRVIGAVGSTHAPGGEAFAMGCGCADCEVYR